MTPSSQRTEQLDAIISTLKADYDRFPKDQTYDIYAEDVYFKDPTSEFRGLDRYRETIAFIDRWFKNPVLELHDIQVLEDLEFSGDRPALPASEDTTLRTDWTLTWTTPLPWQPRISISGWSELIINKRYLIVSHIDYWNCTFLDVIGQHLPRL